MKTISFCFVACLTLTQVALAQVATEMDSSKLDINTTGEISIDLSMYFKLDTIFAGKLAKPAPRVEVRDSRTQQTLISSSVIRIRIGQTFIRFKILFGTDSRSFVELFRNSSQPIHFYMSDSLHVLKEDGDTLVLTPDQIAEFTSQQSLQLTQEQMDELLDAKNGYLKAFKNYFDAGMRDAPNDTIDRSGYIDFTFSQTLFRGAYTQVSGLLTSNLEENVANVRITPFALRKISTQSLVINTFVQSTLNGNEMRLGGGIFYNGLFPNFMDLTQGYNRLRPKPLVNIGFNIGYYSKSAKALVEKEAIAEPFIDLEYYVPVQDKYTVHLQLHAFLRSDPGKILKFDDDNANWHWILSIHYSVKGFTKVIGKYSYGTDSFTQETDNRFMLGFLVGLVEQ